MHIEANIPLAPRTTFEIGGPARYYTEVKSEADVREALSWSRENNTPFFILGGGSNVLIPDAGFDGLVIHIADNGFSFKDTTLDASAGSTLLDLIRVAAGEGLGGWEKIAGIPGTIGGAVRGNAGAFGPEIKDFVTWVRAIHTTTEEVHTFSNAECAFDYRTSFFKKNPEWLILDVQARLAHVEPAESMMSIHDTIAEREKRHIQNVKAAGSFFMNPVAPLSIVSMFEQEKGVTSRGGRVPAGWLIDKAGMKGAQLGGAQVSPLQANYIINADNATAEQVRELATKVKEEVRRHFDVALQEEAVVL